MSKRFLSVLSAVAILIIAPAPRTNAADRPYLAAATDTAKWIRSTAVKTAHGTSWPAVHAEHRVRPKEVAAQTGWMQGAAGIGAWLLRLDAHQQNRQSSLRFPDLPF